VDQEVDNIRAVLSWSAEHHEAKLGMRVIAGLAYWWRTRAHMPDFQVMQRLTALVREDARAGNGGGVAAEAAPAPAESAPQAPPPGADLGMALLVSAVMTSFDTDWRLISAETRQALRERSATVADTPMARARADFEEGLALFRHAGNVPAYVLALTFYSTVALELGDEQRSAALAEEALALSRQAGDRLGEGRALLNLEDLAFVQGEYARAAEWLAASVAVFEAVGDFTYLALAMLRQALLLWAQGDPTGAAALCRPAIERAHQIGYYSGIAEGLEALALTLCDLGQPERAVRALGALESLRTSMATGLGRSARPTRLQLIEPAIARLRAALGDDGYAAAFAAGRALPLDEAVAEALAEGGAPLSATEPGDTA
jgi:tetratricopeptide (TPR) repeat protein